MIDLQGKRLLVLGLGVTGIAVAEAASARGAEVFAYDDKEAAVEASRVRLEQLGVVLLGFERASEERFDISVVSPGIPPTNALALTLGSNGASLISEIELAYLVAKAPIVAITGTNGKSTTTVLAGGMLKASGIKTYIGGNLSAEGYDLPLITAAMQAGADDAIVAEVSSFQLERSYQFRPRSAALLNVSEDHLNRYGDIFDYADAKMRIFQSQGPEDTSVLGWDSELVRERSGQVRGRLLWFSDHQEVDQGAFLRGEDLILRIDGGEDVFAVSGEMKLWASYDKLNALASACVAWGMNATLSGITEAAVTFAGLPHRMEDCGSIDGVRWLNNSMCTNPAAGSAAVKAVAEKYPAIVIAGGAEKGCDYSEWGCTIADSAKLLLLIGQDSEILEEAARRAGVQSILRLDSLQDAMQEARHLAQRGDAVVLAPAMASFGEFTNFRIRGQKFKALVEAFRKEAEE